MVDILHLPAKYPVFSSSRYDFRLKRPVPRLRTLVLSHGPFPSSPERSSRIGAASRAPCGCSPAAVGRWGKPLRAQGARLMAASSGRQGTTSIPFRNAKSALQRVKGSASKRTKGIARLFAVLEVRGEAAGAPVPPASSRGTERDPKGEGGLRGRAVFSLSSFPWRPFVFSQRRWHTGRRRESKPCGQNSLVGEHHVLSQHELGDEPHVQKSRVLPTCASFSFEQDERGGRGGEIAKSSPFA